MGDIQNITPKTPPKAKGQRNLFLCKVFSEYTENTTLHGIQYLHRRISLTEKIFWLLTFILSLAVCSHQIHSVMIKWKTSPVIVSFSEQPVPVGVVPFPSVTICPQEKAKQTVYNFTKEAQNYDNKTLDDREKELFYNIELVCGLNSGLPLDKPSQGFTWNDTIINDLLKVAPTVSDVFDACQWRGETLPCEEMFKPVWTMEGLCFNFNSLSSNEIFSESLQDEYKYLHQDNKSIGWSLEKGYNNSEQNPYPRRGRENSAKPDLEISLMESYRRDGFCNALANGFKIYIQHPADMPRSSLYYYAALPKQVSSMALKFNMVSTSESLQGYEANVRQCYFPKDRRLQYFKIYTINNCKIECQSNYTMTKCGCVWFNMPYSDSKHICTVNDTECVYKASEELANREMIEGPAGGCNCLPACDSIQYDAEILKTDLDYKRVLRTIGNLYEININEEIGVTYSQIQMYFKEPRFLSMRRSELFGYTDFLANCGGLLSLFLGFSFLSIVEIIYFCTLRLCCILRRHRVTKPSND